MGSASKTSCNTVPAVSGGWQSCVIQAQVDGEGRNDRTKKRAWEEKSISKNKNK